MENTKKISFSTFLEDLAYVTQKILGTNDRIPAKDIPKLLYEYYDGLSDDDKSQIISVINTAVVPTGTYIDTVYINKAISPDEVIDSISKLNFIKDLYKPGYYGYRITAATAGPVGIHVLTKNPDDVSKSMLIVMKEMIRPGVYQDIVLFSTNAELSYEYNGTLTVGWNSDASDTLEIKHTVYDGDIVDNFTNELLNVTSHMNGLLCKIFSVIPYEKTSLNFENGEYYNSEVFITKNGEYTLADFMNDKVLPSKITANVAATLSEIEVTPTNETQIIEAEDVDGFNKIKVNPIPDEYLIPELQEKSVTPSIESQEILPDEEYDGLSKVTVSPIPNEYMKTTDATATSEDILMGKTAYIGEGKIEGSIGTYDGEYDGNAVIMVPSVSNLLVNVDGVASWNAPNLEGLEGLDYECIYIVKVNNTELETTKTFLDIMLYLKEGVNIISVVVKIVLTTIKNSNEKNEIIEFSLPSFALTVLDATLPNAMYTMSSTIIGTNVYLFGGFAGSTAYKTILKFDTITETITTLTTTLPSTYRYLASEAMGTDIYLFGGIAVNNKMDTILKFDTVTETITTLTTTLPTTSANMSSAVIGTNIYLFGGYTGSVTTNTYLNQILKFDTTTETIATLTTTLPTTYAGMSSATIGTNVYLFGGGSSSSSSYTKNTILKFDTTTETITTLTTTLPNAYTRHMSSAVIGTNVYLFGGYNGSNSSSSRTNKIYMFDTITETITTLATTLPNDIYDMVSATIGTNVYLFGGNCASSANNKIYKFIE